MEKIDDTLGKLMDAMGAVMRGYISGKSPEEITSEAESHIARAQAVLDAHRQSQDRLSTAITRANAELARLGAVT